MPELAQRRAALACRFGRGGLCEESLRVGCNAPDMYGSGKHHGHAHRTCLREGPCGRTVELSFSKLRQTRDASETTARPDSPKNGEAHRQVGEVEHSNECVARKGRDSQMWAALRGQRRHQEGTVREGPSGVALLLSLLVLLLIRTRETSVFTRCAALFVDVVLDLELR